MKTKLLFALFCFTLLATALSAQQSELKVTITKKVREADGSMSSETIVKKGAAAQSFNIDQYLKDNKADNTDLEIRSEGGDEERSISIKGSDGPGKMRFKTVEKEITEEVERSVDWIDEQVRVNTRRINSNDYDNKAFLGVEEDSDEDDDEPGLIVEVTPNAAADQAGLRDNDMIISINGTKMDRWSDLTRFMANAEKGDKVKIIYSRNGKEATTEAALTTRKDVKPVDCVKQDTKGFLGVSPATYNYNEDVKGVKITVVKNSAAEKAGLENGDILLQLNDTKVEDFEDVEDFMQYIKAGEKINVTYERKGKKNTLEVTVGAKQCWDWGQIESTNNNNNIDVNIRTKEACLGIYNGSAPIGNVRGANIVNFTANSGAKAAGLQINDLVVTINDARVQNTDELWQELSKYKPSETIRVGYLRDGEEFTASVALTPCNDASSRIIMTTSDNEGNGSERSFFAWNLNENDKEELRTRQAIPIRKAGLEDAPMVSFLSGNESNPVKMERTLQLQNIKITPQPAGNPITIEFSASPNPTVITLYDLTGRQLFQEELNAFSGTYSQQFDLKELTPGVIMLRIQQGKFAWTEQIDMA